MSWADIRHLHLLESVPKKEIARRLKLDVQTVRRAVARSTPPVRVSPPPSALHLWREWIKQWLCEEPRLTAKRIRRLLRPMAGPVPAPTVRRYVAALRAAAAKKEVLRTPQRTAGDDEEVDFGESWVDLPTRHLDDGRSVEEALPLERRYLRAMPAHPPATCRVVTRVADKFRHVRADKVTYTVPIRHAYRSVCVKLYHDRVAIAVGAEVGAEHPAAFCRGARVLDALHVLPLLEREHGAVVEATALPDWRLAPTWQQARAELAKHTRKPDQEWPGCCG